MSKFYKFIKGTDAWEALDKCFTYFEKWKENREEIEQFLGFPMVENLYHDVDTLTINPKVMPDEWATQFKKYSTPAVAKVNSKINKQWKELCNRLGLEVHRVSFFSFAYGIYGGGTYHSMYGDYYFAYTNEHRDLKDEHISEIMEEISEVEFLELRAKHLKERESIAS